MRVFTGCLALLAFGLLSIGCGAPGQPGPAAPANQGPAITAPSKPEPPAQPARPSPPANPTPTQASGVRSLSPADTASQAAQAELARRLNVSAEQIQVVSIESVEWPDASLGCPQPGQMYIQVITPGYKVTLSAGGQQYEVHTDLRGRAVMCR